MPTQINMAAPLIQAETLAENNNVGTMDLYGDRSSSLCIPHLISSLSKAWVGLPLCLTLH